MIATTASIDAGQARGIDKSVLAVAAPRRYRNREHLRYVAQQACLVCGRKPSDPHHLGFTQPRALGRKVSDEFAVPLCRGHHRAVHRSRDERAGGDRLASTRSKLPADSGRRRTEWDRGDLDEKYHLGREALPRPLIQGARTSAPLRPRKRNPPYRNFPDKRTRSGRMRGIDNDDVET